MTASIRKRKGKDKVSWQLALEKGYDASGKRIREYYTFDTKEEAEEKKIEILHKNNIGTYVEPSKITVKELCEDWFDCHVVELAPNTQRGYRINLNHHVYPYIGHIKLQKLTPVMVKSCYDELKKKGLSPRSIHYVHTTLHSALEYAYKMQIVPRNVTEFVQLPKETKYQPTVYEKEDIQALLSACRGTEFEIPINITLGLGLRRGEPLGLMWSDIDFSKRTVHICHNLTMANGNPVIGKTKTQKSDRELLMPQYIVDMLKSYKATQAKERLLSGGNYENNDLVVCRKNGKPYDPGSFSKLFGDFLKKNKLKHCRFHDLRHANATFMLKLGVPMKIASERLGHSNIQTTMNIYTHVTTDMQIDAANLLDSYLYGQEKKA